MKETKNFFLALGQKIYFWFNQKKLFSISSLIVVNTVGPILPCFNISDIIASKEIFLFTCDSSVARGICFPGEEKVYFVIICRKFAVRDLQFHVWFCFFFF